MQLEKFVNKIIVQYSNSTEIHEYANTTLAKIELDRKKINNARVIVEYQIKVKNIGEAGGYAKSIVDKIPEGMKFSSELNKDWYLSNGKLYNVSISNEKIEAGQEKTLTLTLTRTITENNTGSIRNVAQIEQSYNDLGITEENNTKDNFAQADVIISIKTGTIPMYIGLAVSIFTIIIVGIYFINKEVLVRDRKEEENE